MKFSMIQRLRWNSQIGFDARTSVAAIVVLAVVLAVVLTGIAWPGHPALAAAPASGAAPTKAAAKVAADSASTSPAESPAVVVSPQVTRINEEIAQGWKDSQIPPSPAAPDNEWCRRVYLDILGRIPSVPELQEFTADKSSDRKLKLVQRLLRDEKYMEEYARNWTGIWTNILIGRAGGTENRSMTSREGMQKYLRDSFARNKPYDKMVFELVTATGTNLPGSDKFNGAVNFLVQKLEEKASLATAKTAQVFLGLQVQCTQCHNHPFNDWKQQKFWEFNAFFRQTAALRRNNPGNNRDTREVELVDQDFRGEGGNPQDAELYYELRNGLLKVAYPAFVDGKEVAHSGFVSEVNRRQELGKLIVNSKYMPEAMVNRMWQYFLGYGFTKPIDDLGSHNVPTHPELLKYLGEQFRDHSFDIKELITWITLSEPYSLSSRFVMGEKGNTRDDPSIGEKPKFSHFYMRQLSAEQMYESLIVATQAGDGRGSYEEQEKLKGEWLKQFVVAFGNDEGAEATTFNGTIPQALMMFNGDLVKNATSVDNGSFLAKVANGNLSPPEKINFLYAAALARKPFPAELYAANSLLVANKNDVRSSLADIWWAVLNSNEFILQH